MKSVRKSIALLLALVMVLALSTAAFAAPVTYLDGATLGYTVPRKSIFKLRELCYTEGHGQDNTNRLL